MLSDTEKSEEIENINEFFSEVMIDGTLKFVCNLCDRKVSRKQRIFSHLEIVHKISKCVRYPPSKIAS